MWCVTETGTSNGPGVQFLGGTSSGGTLERGFQGTYKSKVLITPPISKVRTHLLTGSIHTVVYCNRPERRGHQVLGPIVFTNVR